MSNFQPVSGDTRYSKFWKTVGKRVTIIVLSNKTPESIYWPAGTMSQEDIDIRREQFESRFNYYELI